MPEVVGEENEVFNYNSAGNYDLLISTHKNKGYCKMPKGLGLIQLSPS
jgi:hypothetical protein